MTIIRVTLVVLIAMATFACSNKSSSSDQSAECETADDCRRGWKCANGNCVKPTYTKPRTAVTPDKVKRELEQVNKDYEKKVDKALDM